MHEARQARIAASRKPGDPPDMILGRSDRDMVFGRALLASNSSRDFEAPLSQALETYRHDLATNAALQELWPSTQALRTVLRNARQILGADAAAYLDRIPDPALRLYARIELAAALAGLLAWAGTRR